MSFFVPKQLWVFGREATEPNRPWPRFLPALGSTPTPNPSILLGRKRGLQKSTAHLSTSHLDEPGLRLFGGPWPPSRALRLHHRTGPSKPRLSQLSPNPRAYDFHLMHYKCCNLQSRVHPNTWQSLNFVYKLSIWLAHVGPSRFSQIFTCKIISSSATQLRVLEVIQQIQAITRWLGVFCVASS